MKLTKEQLIEKWSKRLYSWSQHSLFRDWDKEEWYQSYVIGIKKPSNKKMDFGSAVGKRIENDPTYIPQLPRGVMEYGINVKMGDIELVGYMDSYKVEDKHIHEFKTSASTGWTREKVESHDQLTMYCLLLMLKEKIKPEDVKITLHHLHTEESGDFSIKFASPFTIVSYNTKRTTKQCLKFGSEIIKIRKEMLKYIQEHE